MATLSLPTNTPTLDGAVIGCTTDDTTGIVYAMARTDRQWYFEVSVNPLVTQAMIDADKATIIAQDITASELVWAGTDLDLSSVELTVTGLSENAGPFYVGLVQDNSWPGNIRDFDEIPDLYAYWNVHVSVDETGGVVNSITSLSGSAHPLTLTATGSSDITVDVTTVGAMRAINNGLNQNSAMTSALTGLTSGCTIVSVEKRATTNSGLVAFSLEANYGRFTRSGGYYAVTNGTIAYMAAGDLTTDPTVVGFINTGIDNADSNQQWFNGVRNPYNATAQDHLVNAGEVAWIGMAGNPANTSLYGAASIFLLYNRALTQQEMLDVSELAEYWIENGSAPA